MLMPGRMFSSDKYRYSFNTQEKSDEISGIGNHTTTIYWEYDTRLGRRWNLDPIAMSDESEYVVNGNNPLFYIDPLGDFKTKFGAKLYNFLHGGKGEISQANAGNRKGEWFVGKQVDYEGDGEGVAYKRTFGWNNKKITKATDAIGDFAENAEFTAEGKAKISFGAQIGISGTVRSPVFGCI